MWWSLVWFSVWFFFFFNHKFLQKKAYLEEKQWGNLLLLHTHILFFLNIPPLTRHIFLLMRLVGFFPLSLAQNEFGCGVLTLWAPEATEQGGDLAPPSSGTCSKYTFCCLTSRCCQGDCHQFTDVTLLRQVRRADWGLCKEGPGFWIKNNQGVTSGACTTSGSTTLGSPCVSLLILSRSLVPSLHPGVLCFCSSWCSTGLAWPSYPLSLPIFLLTSQIVGVFPAQA